MKEAIEKKMTMADFEMSISVKSAERIRQDQRQSTVQEARFYICPQPSAILTSTKIVTC